MIERGWNINFLPLKRRVEGGGGGLSEGGGLFERGSLVDDLRYIDFTKIDVQVQIK